MMGLRSGDPTDFSDLHAFVTLKSRRDRNIGQSTYVLFVFFVVNPFGTSENAKSTQVGEVV